MNLIYNIDRAVVDFMLSSQNKLLTGFFTIFTVLSEKGLIWIALGIFLLINKKTRKVGVYYAISLAAAFLLSEAVIKNIVCRDRPFIDNDTIKLIISPPSGYSFPSSHSASSFASAVSLFMHNRKYGFIALAVALMVAISRLYFTVHFFSDVIGGALLGSLVAVIIYAALKKIENRKASKE